MSDIVAFLTARLDEDEAVVRAVEDNSAPWDGQWEADNASAVRTHNGHVLVYACRGGDLKSGVATHIARHDPARVLREVEAKRAILREIDAITIVRIDGAPDEAFFQRPAGRLLLALAAPYADHPDYDPAWRVE